MEAVVAYAYVLSQHSFRGTAKDHEYISKQADSRLRSELGAFRVLDGGTNHLDVIFHSNYMVCTPYYVTLIW